MPKSSRIRDHIFPKEYIHPPRSLADQIYEHLKAKILHGDIKPGERMMQIPVAEKLSISRTPVRDAFRRLEQDGLVEKLPQGGVRVSVIPEETVKEVFGIRRVLETYALQIACGKITAEEITLLKNLKYQAQEILAAKRLNQEAKIRQLFELNSRFHEIIYAATGNVYLLNILNNLRNIVSRLRYLGLQAGETWKEVWEEHAQLINFLEKRDKKGALNLLNKHLDHAANYVLSSLRQELKKGKSNFTQGR
ncbi:MAG: GntR family transcriptional regulator [Thermodesulfobacteriota bacterium]